MRDWEPYTPRMIVRRFEIGIVIALAAGLSAGCGEGISSGAASSVRPPAADVRPEVIHERKIVERPLSRAKRFKLTVVGNCRAIEIHHPWTEGAAEQRYVLVARGSDPPAGVKERGIVRIPLRRIGATSTTYLPALVELGALDKLAAFSAGKYAHNPEVRRRHAAGDFATIGDDLTQSGEKLLSLGLDAMITTGMTKLDAERYSRLVDLGLPVMLTAEVAEETPLGRAEWIKFFGALFEKEDEADRLYAAIEKRYEELAQLARGAKVKPTVLLNAPYRGEWHVPGGRNHMARILADAGAAYLWADMDTDRSIPLAPEAVVAKAQHADFWLHCGQFTSRAEVKAADSRLADFDAWKNGKIVNNDARRIEGGGNDYWESGLQHPEGLLADLVRALHPELLPKHELVWYRFLP
ncbi:MAG TPA: ABC transporter substrate-binding protein [Planctomycetia bacterium]|nr:ABC transporter substrate-binding protein [Planctomycetia bacterium]